MGDPNHRYHRYRALHRAAAERVRGKPLVCDRCGRSDKVVTFWPDDGHNPLNRRYTADITLTLNEAEAKPVLCVFCRNDLAHGARLREELTKRGLDPGPVDPWYGRWLKEHEERTKGQ